MTSSARKRVAIDRTFAAFPRVFRILVAILSLVLLGLLPFLTHAYLESVRAPDVELVQRLALTGLLVSGLGAFLLVALVSSARTPIRMLTWQPVAWLGDVSYSLYLVHVPILLLVAPVLRPSPTWQGFGIVATVVLGLSAVVATLLHAAVEKPAIRLGNRACRGLARWLGAPAIPSKTF